MSPRQVLRGEQLAVGGQISVDPWAIPCGATGFVIIGLLSGIIPSAADLIRITDTINTRIGRNGDFGLLTLLRGAPRREDGERKSNPGPSR